VNIALITPGSPASRTGNRITALRWASILKSLGHRVRVGQEYEGEPCDLMVALHARRSAEAIERFRALHSDRPLVLALTGTDLYQDIRTSPEAKRSLELATRVVVLQPSGVEELPLHQREKVRVIHQSAPGFPEPVEKSPVCFEVCVLAHLRAVKDPFRAALAARLLPASSRIRILQVGAALSEDMAQQARAEVGANPRYRWLGDLPHRRALRVLAGSHLLVLSSHMEGGANALSEAVSLKVPVVASRIPGTVGILGEDYPGLFTPENTEELARLLSSAETDTRFYRALQVACTKLTPLVRPQREKKAWQDLLQELR